MTVHAALLGGRYRLDKPIGRGGMASVWRALDQHTGRVVAIKRLHAGPRDEGEAAERFRLEAEVVQRLSHPNLVALLDRGEDSEAPYLVFEFVDGRDLKSLIREHGRLRPERAAEVCAQIARALDHAHAEGVVHRDIKSHNVLVTPTGTARLTDFGIACLMGEEAGLTKTGMMIGTSDYLAPEQAQGHAVDGRADIYALGIVLYECLTARLPFPAESALAVALRQINDPLPDPRALVADLPAGLVAALDTATRKNPDERFPRARGLALALEREARRIAQGTAGTPSLRDRARSSRPRTPPARSRPPRAAPRRTAGAVAVSVAGIALLSGGVGVGLWASGVLGTRSEAPAAEVPIASVPLTIVRVTDVDPVGGDGERHDIVGRAHDGDPATAWSTEGYDSATFSGIPGKTGVGLQLTLAAPARLTSLVVTSPLAGGRFEIRAGLGGPVLGRGSFAAGARQVALSPVAARSDYLLWITRLPRDPRDGMYRAYVSEIAAQGAP